jgi:hypothetical protein
LNPRRARVALLACLLSTSAAAKSFDDRAVSRDSELVRTIHALPLTSELFELQVAHETLRLAQDEPTATALEAYLSGLAVAALGGSVPKPTGATIGDLASARSKSQDRAALAAFLDSSVRATLVKAGERSLVARIDNISSHPIRQYDVKLALPRSGQDVYEFSCDRLGYVVPPLAPGQGSEQECRVELFTGGIEAYLAALRPGAVLPVAPRSIEFQEPSIMAWREIAQWRSTEEARSAAVMRLRAMPCGMRGACADDFGDWLSQHPQFLVGLLGGVAGFVLGALIGRFTRHHRRNASIVSIAGVGVAVAAWFAMGASNAGLASVLLLFLAAGLVAAFLIALWVGTALFARARPQL